jgi:hypothetical protein
MIQHHQRENRESDKRNLALRRLRFESLMRAGTKSIQKTEKKEKTEETKKTEESEKTEKKRRIKKTYK